MFQMLRLPPGRRPRCDDHTGGWTHIPSIRYQYACAAWLRVRPATRTDWISSRSTVYTCVYHTLAIGHARWQLSSCSLATLIRAAEPATAARSQAEPLHQHGPRAQAELGVSQEQDLASQPGPVAPGCVCSLLLQPCESHGQSGGRTREHGNGGSRPCWTCALPVWSLWERR